MKRTKKKTSKNHSVREYECIWILKKKIALWRYRFERNLLVFFVYFFIIITFFIVIRLKPSVRPCARYLTLFILVYTHLRPINAYEGPVINNPVFVLIFFFIRPPKFPGHFTLRLVYNRLVSVHDSNSYVTNNIL